MNAEARILVVDDEASLRDSLAGWLTEDGYRVETAADGAAAVARLRAAPYAMLLVDLKLPGMDGLAVLAEARALQPDAAVVVMTAYATVETAVHAMKLGATDYLVKPFEPEALSVLAERVTTAQMVRGQQAQPPASDGASGSLKEMERRYIAASLRAHGWNISRTARALQIDRVTLYNKINRYRIREEA